MSSTDQQGSSLGSFPTFPSPLSPLRPSGFWPCVKSCLVTGSDKYYIYNCALVISICSVIFNKVIEQVNFQLLSCSLCGDITSAMLFAEWKSYPTLCFLVLSRSSQMHESERVPQRKNYPERKLEQMLFKERRRFVWHFTTKFLLVNKH